MGLGQARVHLELAAAYRQALLLGAHATVGVYGELRRDEDPPEVDCLLVVSYALLPQDDPEAERLSACETSDQADLVAHAKAWHAWSAKPAWPPTAALATTPGQPGEPVAGALPDAGALPHWTLKDLVEGLKVPVTSPAGLLGLALFHEQAALAAAPDAAPAIRALLTPWRLHAEPVTAPDATLAVPTELLFGSSLLVPADVAFMAAVAGSESVGETVTDWAGRSVLAAAVAPCADWSASTLPEGCVSENAGRAFDQLRSAMEIRSGGEAGYHRPFAEMGRLGVVRAGQNVADAVGAEKDGGLLRLQARDLAIGTSAEPHYLLSIAAWDAGNRNSSRASDALHAQVGHIPGVEVARFPLDALHVRLSRESAPGVPMH
jgi:hypothetical protein